MLGDDAGLREAIGQAKLLIKGKVKEKTKDIVMAELDEE